MNVGTDQKSLWTLFIEKLESHPELIEVARENCARWLREGHSGAAQLREWDALLAQAQSSAEGFLRLRTVLEGVDECSMRLREFHPLAGILTRDERRQAKELCGYRH
jgi:hypothetical protein